MNLMSKTNQLIGFKMNKSFSFIKKAKKKNSLNLVNSYYFECIIIDDNWSLLTFFQ